MLAVPSSSRANMAAHDDAFSTSSSSYLVASPSNYTDAKESTAAGPWSRPQVCGKRSRSNSVSSSSGSSSLTDSASLSSSEWNSSDADSDSPATSQASDEECRSCPSPSESKRKAVRCLREETACTAASLPHTTSATDITGLDGAVKAFGLSSRDPSPISSQSAAIPASLDSTRVKGSVVDSLVDSAVATIDAIWHAPLPLAEQPIDVGCSASSLPLQLFIRETLRRSRTSCSTLQAALLYCVRAAPTVRKTRLQFASMQRRSYVDPTMAIFKAERQAAFHHLLCGRRNFLAAVMVAAKFLQDRNYSNKAWSKITGLPLKELGSVEREFLAAIKWDLNVKSDEWEGWTRKLAQAQAKQQARANAQIQASSQPQPQPQPFSASSSTSMMTASEQVQQERYRNGGLRSLAPALPASVLQLKAAETPSRPSTAGSSSPASSSSCVTPTLPSTPTAMAAAAPTELPSHPGPVGTRSVLARSNSDQAPLRAFDTSLGSSGVPAELPAEDQGKATITASIAHPFPMPRVFARNAASFSGTEQRRGAEAATLAPTPVTGLSVPQ